LRRKAHLRRGSSVDSRRNTPVVDFGVERHTLVTGEITQVFHQSSATVLQGFNSRGTLVQGEGATSEEV
jgi:hypothetical protein